MFALFAGDSGEAQFVGCAYGTHPRLALEEWYGNWEDFEPLHEEGTCVYSYPGGGRYVAIKPLSVMEAETLSGCDCEDKDSWIELASIHVSELIDEYA